MGWIVVCTLAGFAREYSDDGMSGKNVTEVVPADADGIAKAARILESGGLVAVPTETVYGLAARADQADAVAKIYAAKGRPDFNPLIVHARNRAQAERYAVFPHGHRDWTDQYWPGPMTLVLPLKSSAGLAPAVTAGLPTIALRVPEHPVMQDLLASVDFPIAAPSANRSGFISPTNAEHVLASLDGRIDLVIDGGPTKRGVESTIIAIREDGSWEELRPGPIDTGESSDPSPYQHAQVAAIEAPGQLVSHYSPGKPVRLNAAAAKPDEFMIGYGAVEGDCSLSEAGNLEEAAARLYDCLHIAARSEKPRVAVAPIPDEGQGRAINDRLRRAAAPTD